MTERGFGADSGLDQEETSASKDVRTGYQADDDQPAPRVSKTRAKMMLIPTRPT